MISITALKKTGTLAVTFILNSLVCAYLKIFQFYVKPEIAPIGEIGAATSIEQFLAIVKAVQLPVLSC